MKTFELELFDSRNTSLPRRYTGNRPKEYASNLSEMLGVHHVIVYLNGGWAEYEKGEKVSWTLNN